MKITVVKGDITELVVDAIVNAANSSLLGGGGVDGAIHRKGGSEILEDCMKIRQRQGKCKTGEALITRAGKLSAKHVIHTVGPVWNGGGKQEPDKLRECYQNSLNLAIENECQTIAFPGISTGIYRYPKLEAARIAFDCVVKYENRDELNEVIFVCFDDESHGVYLKLYDEYKAGI